MEWFPLQLFLKMCILLIFLLLKIFPNYIVKLKRIEKSKKNEIKGLDISFDYLNLGKNSWVGLISKM